jgi:hypothetical protein
MKYSVIRFKNLKICIKELERFIRDGEHLQTGKSFKQFDNLRSREILANWLLCVAINFEHQFDKLTFCSDPQGGDGIIYDNTSKKGWPTEHILVPRDNKKPQDIESLILVAIEKKQNKGGTAYASGKTLIIFLNANGGEWYPNKVAKKLPKGLDFEDIWVIGLQGVIHGEYLYNVIRLDANGSPVWQVHIEINFDAWEVKRIQ